MQIPYELCNVVEEAARTGDPNKVIVAVEIVPTTVLQYPSS